MKHKTILVGWRNPVRNRWKAENVSFVFSIKELRKQTHIQQPYIRLPKLITRKKNEKWERTCSWPNTYMGGKKSAENWRLIWNIREEYARESH